jgi:hypothetical protein
MSMFQKFIGTHARVRFRTHFGSHTECQYALMSFGILPDCLPVDTEGNKNCTSLNQWIEKRKILEAGRNKMGAQDISHMLLSQLEFELRLISRKPAYDKAKFFWPMSVTDPHFCLQFLRAADFNPYKAARLLLGSLPCVEDERSGLLDLMLWLEKRRAELQVENDTDDDFIKFPTLKDVLLGRGLSYQNFPGNQYYISVVEMHMESYNDAGPEQKEKRAISGQVLKMLQQSGARFLQRADNATDSNVEDGWVQVDDQAARKKICHAFRNIRLRKGHASAPFV